MLGTTMARWEHWGRLGLATATAGLLLMGCGSIETPPITPDKKVAVAGPSLPAPDCVAMGTAVDNRFVEAGQGAEVLARLRIDVTALQQGDRPAINLALVVDTSGSMEGEPMADARSASLAMLEALSPGDRLAVVAFGSTAEVLFPSTELDTASIAAAREQIQKMQAHGTTDMAGGLSAGLQQVRQHLAQGGVNRVVLLGDGIPNDETQLPPLARNAGQQGISVTALGLGLEYDETVMSTIAQLSGGKFHFVRESSKVASMFEEEVLRLERVVGRNAHLTLKPGPGVTIQDVVGLQSTPAGRGVRMVLGDLSEGQQRDVIVKLSAPARRAGAVVEMLDAELTYQDAINGAGAVKEHAFVAIRTSDDPAEIEAGHDPDVERSAARVQVAAMVVEAVRLARAGDLPNANANVDAAEKLAGERAETLDDEPLRQNVREMAALRASLPSLVAPPTPSSSGPVSPGHEEGPDQPSAAPAPAAAAETVRHQHSRAMSTIQGE